MTAPMETAADLLRLAYLKVAVDGIGLIKALDESGGPRAEYCAAIDALYKSIPWHWRLRHGSWSPDVEMRHDDIRNWCLLVPAGVSGRREVLALIDRALRKVGANPVEICGRGGNA